MLGAGHFLSLALCFSAALGQYDWYEDNAKMTAEPDVEDTTVDMYISRRTTTVPTTTTSSSSARPSEFQMEFWSFEKRMKSFVESIRRNQLATLSGTVHFREEIHRYVSRLPKNVSRTVTIKYREICDCDSATDVSPCPEECVYSCYRDGYGYILDCRSARYTGYEYRCRQGSSRLGTDINVKSECGVTDKQIERTTEDDTSCSGYAPDGNKMLESFDLFANLLVEPLRMFYRGIESRLTLIRESAASVDHLSEIATLVCSDMSDPVCSEEAPRLLRSEGQHLRALKKNITLDLIKAQDGIKAIAKSVEYLREQTIAQVVRTTKEYACCLKALNFTVEGYDCNPAPVTELPTTVRPSASCKFDSICPPAVSFLCANRKCIPRSLVCDGSDDCGDLSDENVCLSPIEDDDD